MMHRNTYSCESHQNILACRSLDGCQESLLLSWHILIDWCTMSKFSDFKLSLRPSQAQSGSQTYSIGISMWLRRKVSVCNTGDLGSIPGSGRSPGERNGNPLQYSCLENPMDRGAWQATVHGVAKSRTRLSNFTYLLTYASHQGSCTHRDPSLVFSEHVGRS